MEFDRGHRESPGGVARAGTSSGVPGKRTLTEGLPGARRPGLIQRKQEPGASQNGALSGGEQTDGPVVAQQTQGAPLDARGTVIHNLLQSYQSIDVQVPVPNIGAAHGQEWEIGSGFDGLLDTIDAILSQRTAGQAAPVDQLHAPAQSLIEWCRANLPDQARSSPISSPASRATRRSV